jgi:hypothetical protein
MRTFRVSRTVTHRYWADVECEYFEDQDDQDSALECVSESLPEEAWQYLGYDEDYVW